MNKLLIFGATGGIGKACISSAIDKGDCRVVCIGNTTEHIDKLKEEFGDSCDYIETDLKKNDSVEEVFSKACSPRNDEDDISKVCGVIYSAGIEGVRPLRVMTTDYFEDVMRINCSTFVQICKCMSSKKYSMDGASIVAISSMTAWSLSVGEGAYGISKAALNAAVQQASLELVGRKIRVNAVLPGSTDTEMFAKVRERIPDIDERLTIEQPLGLIDPKQVARMIDFLLSDDSLYITGACIPISGGRKYF